MTSNFLRIRAVVWRLLENLLKYRTPNPNKIDISIVTYVQSCKKVMICYASVLFFLLVTLKELSTCKVYHNFDCCLHTPEVIQEGSY